MAAIQRRSYTYQVCSSIIGWDNDISGLQHTSASVLTLDLSSRIHRQSNRGGKKMPGLIVKKFSHGKIFR